MAQLRGLNPHPLRVRIPPGVPDNGDRGVKWRTFDTVNIELRVRLPPITHSSLTDETRTLINKCMKYIVYKVTNNVNGKVYVGTHKTENINDGYMGSGKYLNYAINKYGINKFTKEILFVYDNPKDMYDKEAEIVDEDFLAEANTYNLKRGGMGGFDFINENNLNGTLKGVETRRKLFDDENWRKQWSQRRQEGINNRSEESKKLAASKREETMIQRYGTKGIAGFKGRSHTDQAKDKQSKKAKERLKDPTKNSQYGTMWITDGSENKKIRKDQNIPSGWRKGRIIPPK